VYNYDDDDFPGDPDAYDPPVFRIVIKNPELMDGCLAEAYFRCGHGPGLRVVSAIGADFDEAEHALIHVLDRYFRDPQPEFEGRIYLDRGDWGEIADALQFVISQHQDTSDCRTAYELFERIEGWLAEWDYNTNVDLAKRVQKMHRLDIPRKIIARVLVEEATFESYTYAERFVNRCTRTLS
jgi:hypothetical protein